MTRYTNFGRKRTYVEAGFGIHDNDRSEERDATPKDAEATPKESKAPEKRKKVKLVDAHEDSGDADSQPSTSTKKTRKGGKPKSETSKKHEKSKYMCLF